MKPNLPSRLTAAKPSEKLPAAENCGAIAHWPAVLMYPHLFEPLTGAKPSLNERALHNLRMILVGCPACSENTSDELRN